MPWGYVTTLVGTDPVTGNPITSVQAVWYPPNTPIPQTIPESQLQAMIGAMGNKATTAPPSFGFGPNPPAISIEPSGAPAPTIYPPGPGEVYSPQLGRNVPAAEYPNTAAQAAPTTRLSPEVQAAQAAADRQAYQAAAEARAAAQAPPRPPGATAERAAQATEAAAPGGLAGGIRSVIRTILSPQVQAISEILINPNELGAGEQGRVNEMLNADPLAPGKGRRSAIGNFNDKPFRCRRVVICS